MEMAEVAKHAGAQTRLEGTHILGTRCSFGGQSPGQPIEWRGVATLDALRLLRANGRV